MLSRLRFIIGFLLTVLMLVNFGLTTFSQDMTELCRESNLDIQEAKLSDTEYEKLVRSCLAYYEDYYRQREAEESLILKDAQDRRQTLQGELNTLQSRINRMEADINRSSLVVKDLTIQVQDTQSSIEVSRRQIADYRLALADILQLAYEQSRRSPIEIILSGQPLSNIFGDLSVMDNISARAEELLQHSIDLEAYLSGQKIKMEQEKKSIETEIYVQSVQKSNLQKTTQEKDVLLTRTKGEEAIYQQQLAETRRQAEAVVSELKGRLFRMIDSAQEITEYEAVKLALSVADLTGISPAFLLAIIEQESAVGRYVGGCYLTDVKTGMGTCKDSVASYCSQPGDPAPRTMRSSPRSKNVNSDTINFVAITEQLGKDWRKEPVSCWIPYCYHIKSGALTRRNIAVDRSGNIICPAGYAPYGFGGAMGPAQFIPQTWLAYKYRTEKILSVSAANPWNPLHAFTASALLLRDHGADGTIRGHMSAAGKYYGDGNIGYIQGVMRHVEKWDKYIEDIKLAERL
jgi:peptidoglycan hydrolase CwlO-like protein